MQSINSTRMKTQILILLMGSVLFFGSNVYAAKQNVDQTAEQGKSSKLAVVGSPELKDLISAWVAGYTEKHPGQKFDISYKAEDISEGSICFFTSTNPVAGSEGLGGRIVVGHEIIVPFINANSPLMALLEEEGMTAACFSKMLAGCTTWGSVKENAGNLPLQVYALNCGQMDSKLAEFCETNKSELTAVKVDSADELLALVRKDINAVGFCRLSDVVNPEKDDFAGGIRIVPIDKNQNGKIDGFENIYASPEALTRGAWIGKYPRKLCSEVFAASTSLPMDDASNEFLAWVVDQGQDTLASLGFSHLTTRETTAGMLALNPEMPTNFTPSAPGNSNTWITVIAGMVLIFLLYIVIKPAFKRQSGIQSEDISITTALNVNSIKSPGGLFYDKTHTWAFMEQDGFVKVGVDDFLPHVTGKLSQIKMTAPGEKVRKGEKILTLVRDGKHLDIYSPVTGAIKARNEALLENPSQLNADPYQSGWVYQVEPSNWLRETKFMFMADKFKDWLEDEFVRLKDFLAASANANAVVYNHVVLQDGGELTDNVLADLEPAIWEDFQAQFIDASK